MNTKFSDLKPNDIVYVCYDKNHGKGQELIYDACVVEGIVRINEKHLHNHSSSDYYDDTKLEIVENYIKIQISAIDNASYIRSYDNFYDDLGNMTITSGIWASNPTVKVFVNKSDAIDYATNILIKQYQQNLNTISKCQSDNKELSRLIENLAKL